VLCSAQPPLPLLSSSWVVAKDISKLQTHETEAYINDPVKRSGDLPTGYKIAPEPATWEAVREAAIMEDIEAEDNAEIDQLASEDNGDGEKKANKPKKRKTSLTQTQQPSQNPRNRPKRILLNLGIKRKAKNGTKSKALIESEDGGDHEEPEPEDEDGGPSKKASSTPAKKTKRNKDGDGEDREYYPIVVIQYVHSLI
jgi:hypothetical protein